MRLLFLRHAHSVSQEDRTIVVGRAHDKPLSAMGRDQARTAAAVLARYNLTSLYASTCVRTMETAEAVSQATGLEIRTSALLVERSHGVLEGVPKEEAYTPQLIRTIHADQLRWTPEEGESLLDVQYRLARFLSTLSSNESPLIVTHLMVLWSLFHLCTGCHHGILPRLHVDNAGLVEVETDDLKAFRLIRWNQSIG